MAHMHDSVLLERSVDPSGLVREMWGSSVGERGSRREEQ